MDIFYEIRHETLFLRAVAKAIKDAPQIILKPGMLVVHVNNIDQVYKIIITFQTCAKVRLITDGKVEGKIYTFQLNKLIYFNEIFGNYLRQAEKFKKPAVNHH